MPRSREYLCKAELIFLPNAPLRRGLGKENGTAVDCSENRKQIKKVTAVDCSKKRKRK
jgi:hypothetical protein